MKRIFALLLALCMLCPIFAACAENTETDEKESKVAAIDSTEPVSESIAADDDSYLADNLPEEDFDGRTFTILVQNWHELFFEHEETTGEPINDATYTQVTNVEDRYDVDIQTSIAASWGDVNNLLIRSASADDGAYQCSVNVNVTMATLATQNILLDLNQLTYLDFERPWWNSDYKEKLTIGGKTYFAFGDFFTEAVINNTHVLYLNKNICDEYQVDYPYQAVYDGKWTMEYMQTMIKGVKEDLNGDSVYDENDLWGLVQSPIQSSILYYTSGFEIMSYDEDGYPYFDMYNEEFVKFYEDLYKFDFETDEIRTVNKEAENFQMFVNGQAMFSSHFLNETPTLRAVEFEVGILPYPKYNESDEYINWPTGGNYLLVVPSVTAFADYDFVGIVIEAMACQGYIHVRPAIYEQTLQGKLARDQESIDMLDLIFDTITIDFGWIHNGDNGMGWFVNKMLESNLPSFTSLYERFAKRAEKHYESVVDAYRAMG